MEIYRDTHTQAVKLNYTDEHLWRDSSHILAEPEVQLSEIH